MESLGAVPLEETPTDYVPAARVLQPFDELYAAAYGPMVRLAWALVDRRDVAEEVVKDAFATLYSRYGTLAAPNAYLRMCVVNNCRRVLRRRRVVRRKPVATPPTSFEDDYDHLFDVIRQLPRRQRAVVVLRYQQGLRESEIAKTLGIPVGTVKSSLSRAKSLLRKELSL